MRRIGVLLWMVCAAGLAAAAGGEAGEDAPPPSAAGLFEWSLGGRLHLEPGRITDEPRLFDELDTSFLYRHRFLELAGELSLLDDERYTPDEPYLLGRGFLIPAAGLALDFDFATLRLGRFAHRDVIDTPYSLFVSSAELPALLADFTFQGGPFTYGSRWISLNRDSALGYPDRGANLKTFSLRLGNWRFGLQDAAVYTGRAFDPEYFVSPLPAIITQMVTKQDLTPWQEGEGGEGFNDNSISGLFAEWRSPGDRPGLRHSYYAQWLVDDISLDFLIPWFLRDEFGDRSIANKMAWAVGGRWELPFGRLAFHHAGATKYTFEATNDGGATDYKYPYSYTYYPATRYDLDGTWMTLDYQDNYLGYRYGENNLAFMVELARPLLGADFRAALEYVVSGAKSPANPWHDATSAEDAGHVTELLNDPVLEHTLALELAAAWPLGGWIFSTRLRLGGVFNRLEPVAPALADNDENWIFRPQAGEHALLYAVTLGVAYTFRAGGAGREGPPDTGSGRPPAR